MSSYDDIYLIFVDRFQGKNGSLIKILNNNNNNFNESFNHVLMIKTFQKNL